MLRAVEEHAYFPSPAAFAPGRFSRSLPGRNIRFNRQRAPRSAPWFSPVFAPWALPPWQTSRARRTPSGRRHPSPTPRSTRVYGGINFMNGQAGQNLPKRYNMAGGEVMANILADTEVRRRSRRPLGRWHNTRAARQPSRYRPRSRRARLVSQIIGMGGLQYHWSRQPARRREPARAGRRQRTGTFDHSNPGLPAGCVLRRNGPVQQPHSAMGVAGGSIDFNRSRTLAIRALAGNRL